MSPPIISPVPEKGAAVLAPSARIFLSATIVLFGAAVAAVFLKHPAQSQAVFAEVPQRDTHTAASLPLPAIPPLQRDDGSDKIAQVYPPPPIAPITPTAPAKPETPAAPPVPPAPLPVVIPAEKEEPAAPKEEWKGFADIHSEFKTLHTVAKPPTVADNQPFKKFEQRMEAVQTNELNDAILSVFQFADNLQPKEPPDSEPNNPFQDTDFNDESGLRPLTQKETLLELKPIRKVD